MSLIEEPNQEAYTMGFNTAAEDYEKRKARNVSGYSKSYQEGYYAGWEHNANLNPSVEHEEEDCPNCYGGHFRPCQWCGDTGKVIFQNGGHQ